MEIRLALGHIFVGGLSPPHGRKWEAIFTGSGFTLWRGSWIFQEWRNEAGDKHAGLLCCSLLLPGYNGTVSSS